MDIIKSLPPEFSRYPREQISVKADLPDGFRERREQFLAELPQDTEGLDMFSFSQFFHEIGLEVTPIGIYDRDNTNVPAVLDKYKPILSFDFFPDDESGGCVVPAIQLALVARDKSLEHLNGVAYTETAVAHELAHSSAFTGELFRQFLIDRKNGTIGGYVNRVGFKVKGENIRNCFWEEGFASMIAKKYIEKRYGENPERWLAPRGLSEHFSSFDCVEMEFTDGTNGLLSPLYMGRVDENDFRITSNEFAGQALELLCQKYPLLLETLLRARKTVDGLRTALNMLSEITGDNFDYLSNLKTDDLKSGYNRVIEIIKN